MNYLIDSYSMYLVDFDRECLDFHVEEGGVIYSANIPDDIYILHSNKVNGEYALKIIEEKLNRNLYTDDSKIWLKPGDHLYIACIDHITLSDINWSVLPHYLNEHRNIDVKFKMIFVPGA